MQNETTSQAVPKAATPLTTTPANFPLPIFVAIIFTLAYAAYRVHRRRVAEKNERLHYMSLPRRAWDGRSGNAEPHVLARSTRKVTKFKAFRLELEVPASGWEIIGGVVEVWSSLEEYERDRNERRRPQETPTNYPTISS